MLVLDPTRRYTIEQIKRHRWMMADVLKIPVTCLNNTADNVPGGTAGVEPNEDILKMMADIVGIDPAKTRESLKKNSYDHIAAIYLLLQDRVRVRSVSQDNSSSHQLQNIDPNQTHHSPHTHHHHHHHHHHGSSGKYAVPVETAHRRRPSTIAEQAMRKLVISVGGHYGRETPSLSPRHQQAVATNVGYDDPGLVLMPLRDTNIRTEHRENVPPTPNPHMRQHMYGSQMSNCNSNAKLSSIASSAFLAKEREVSSTFNTNPHIRDSVSYLNYSTQPVPPHRSPSNRLLSSGLDQRILKQSSEDCRRLLQQVSRVFFICIL